MIVKKNRFSIAVNVSECDFCRLMHTLRHREYWGTSDKLWFSFLFVFSILSRSLCALLLFMFVYFSESMISILLFFSLRLSAFFIFVALCKHFIFLIVKLVFFPILFIFIIFFLFHFVCSLFMCFLSLCVCVHRSCRYSFKLEICINFILHNKRTWVHVFPFSLWIRTENITFTCAA